MSRLDEICAVGNRGEKTPCKRMELRRNSDER